MKIYLVNEKPDGSGRWWWAGGFCDEQGDYTYATLFEHRRDAAQCEEFGGHVVEFTVGAKPEPRDDPTVAHRYVEIADVLGLVYRAEGRDGVDVASHGRVMEAVRDGQRALAESDEMFAELQRLRTERNKPEPREPDGRLTYGNGMAIPCVFHHVLERLGWHEAGRHEVPVYVGEPPPGPVALKPHHWRAWAGDFVRVAGAIQEYDTPEEASKHGDAVPVRIGDPPQAAEREPDAIMVCCKDGSLDWGNVHEAADPWVIDRAGRSTTRKVYLDTPPAPAPPWRDQLCAVLGWDVPLPDDAYAVQRALTEVSRLKGREETCEALLAKAPEEVSRLKEDLDTALQDSRKLLEERDAALAEVSRLSLALDESRRETESVRVAARELQRQLDELAKQEPVAWRSRIQNLAYGPQWNVTAREKVADNWAEAGRDVERLYAAPKPAAPALAAIYPTDEVHHEPPVMDARDLNTCAACNAGPGAIGPMHTCQPPAGLAPADTPQACAHPMGDRVPLKGSAEWWWRCHRCGVRGGALGVERTAPADTPDRDEEPDGWLGSWCPQCGPDVGVDEGGLCNSCGATAVGDGADHAIRLLRREAAPADAPAMVEADRLIREGWEGTAPGWVHNPKTRRKPKWVGEPVTDAMRALQERGGK